MYPGFQGTNDVLYTYKRETQSLETRLHMINLPRSHKDTQTDKHKYIFTHIYIHTQTLVQTDIHTQTQRYTDGQKQTHFHTHIYINIHTHKQ